MTTTSPQQKRIAWLWLLAAALLEIAFVLFTNASQAFTLLWPSLAAIVTTLFSMVMLSIALRHIDVGTGYTIWVGLGAVGTILFGILLYNEPFTLTRAFCFALIIGGVIGLKLSDNTVLT